MKCIINLQYASNTHGTHEKLLQCAGTIVSDYFPEKDKFPAKMMSKILPLTVSAYCFESSLAECIERIGTNLCAIHVLCSAELPYCQLNLLREQNRAQSANMHSVCGSSSW